MSDHAKLSPGSRPDAVVAPEAIVFDQVAAAKRRRRYIRAYQKETGLTLQEMSRRAGLSSPNSLKNLLAGKSKSVSASTVAALCMGMPKLSMRAMLGLETEAEAEAAAAAAAAAAIKRKSARRTQKSPQASQHRSV